jgi:hypothetical protein
MKIDYFYMGVVMKKLEIGFILSGLLIAGGSPNLSGKWDVQVEGYGAPRTQKFELKQQGEGLSGVYEGKFGESKVNGTVKDSAVDFEMRVIEKDSIITVHYTGTASEEGIKGTVTFGSAGKGTWTASRGVPSHKK